MREWNSLGTRWLGVGLAAALSVLTLGLTLSGQLGLYINPDSAWFAVGMSALALVGAIASFALPLGAESDHGHDHGTGEQGPGPASVHDGHDHENDDHQSVQARRIGGFVVATVGGVLATGMVGLALMTPPATLSPQLAASRASSTPVLFAGSDVVTLAATADTSNFGVGEWATVFATATNPAAFDGKSVTLTGFTTPVGDGFAVSRFVITHCVIDAQPASVAITWSGAEPPSGEWVSITGTVRSGSDGKLRLVATSVQEIAQPEDPYEY